MNQKAVLAKTLRLLASAIESLDERDLDQLLGGQSKLAFVPADKPKPLQPEPTADHVALLAQLNECTERDQARAILSGISNKESLVSFARTQKVYVAKHDRREDIENKIIEFVVGAKLRTEAIQSLNMKGGGGQPAG